VRFVEEILCQIKKRHRSLLGVSEDVAFEIWCKSYQQGALESPQGTAETA